MKSEINCNKKQELYHAQLSTISNIKFTLREMDVIACILHNRGEKKIAALLSISHRTVGTHVHNIMLKLGHSSREYLIDFIEKSDKILFVKQYYLQILIQASFNDHLIKIGKATNRQGLTCVVNCKNISLGGNNILYQLNEDLKLANITLISIDKITEVDKSNCYILTSELYLYTRSPKTIMLLFDENKDSIKSEFSKYVDFRQEKNYYFSVLDLLTKVINHNSLEQTIKEFEQEYQSIANSWKEGSIKVQLPLSTYLGNESFIRKKYIIFFISSILLLIISSCIIVPKVLSADKTQDLEEIRSDLPLPQEGILLKHSSILEQINKKLESKEGIKTVVLVGIGGSGKTTIAYQYARKQNIKLIWEINAATQESLISSFEQLAYSLCKTEEETRQLAMIPQIKDPYEKERKLFLFVAKKVKNYPEWLIIYNNVETFQAIKKYFPYDAKVWGNGKIIITTRDGNIAHNSYILDENVIHIVELTKEEKLELFGKITNLGNNGFKNNKATAIDFLEKIPSFPLDVSTTAYYLKEEKIHYNEYLKYISEQKDSFAAMQEIILNDVGEYASTRYDIITLSIKRIIEEQPCFKDLLLFISLINPSDIPKELLVKYKDDIAFSRFIHALRKFSLIAEKPSLKNQHSSTFSIHRSTQTIALAYLTKSLKLEQNTEQLNDISTILENAMDQELSKNSTTLAILVSHVEAFLSQKKLVNRVNESSLSVKLGIYYFDTANYTKAERFLKEALTVYKSYYGVNHIKTALVSVHLGSVYRNMGDYDNARPLLESAFEVYKKYYGENHIETAWVSTYLGSIHRNIGNYNKAKELLEEALIIYQKNYGKNHIKTARVYAYLASSYKNIGGYKIAQDLLEQALVIYKEYYGLDHAQTAWVLTRLGNVYRSLGDYDKAKELFKQALTIYKKHYGENCIETAWTLSHLGSVNTNLGDSLKANNILKDSLTIYNGYYDSNHVTVAWVLFLSGNAYLQLNDYDKSLKMYKQALTIYEKVYGHDHIQTAGVLNSLGEALVLKDDIESAENILNRALIILQKNKHPESYISLENLTDLYLKKSKQALAIGNIQKSRDCKIQSINYLKQALEIVTTSFPEGSVHIRRVQSKLKSLSV